MKPKRQTPILDHETQAAYATHKGYMLLERSNGWIDYSIADRDYYLQEEGHTPDPRERMETIAEKLADERKLGTLKAIPFETAMTDFVNTNID